MRHLIFLFTLLLCCSCGKKSDNTKALIVADLTKDYPPKEICLQDIAEVEYRPMATSDSMLVNSAPSSVSNEGIAIRGGKVGEILLFDSQGQKLQGRVCSRGQGPEEYNAVIFNIVDWKRKEVFIADYVSLKVYDFTGKYLRTLLKDNIMKMYICNLDNDHLLCSYEKEGTTTPYHPYFLLSKENGKVDTLSIKVPHFIAGNRKVLWDDGRSNNAYGFLPQLFKSYDRIWLTNHALDTVFQMHPDQTLEPAMVPLHAPTTDKEAPLLYFLGMNDRYAWISRMPRNVTVRMSDITANREKSEKVYMYDRLTREWFEPIYHNRDITSTNMDPKFINTSAVPYGYGLVQLNAIDLVDAYQNNKIVDERLKKIASTLQEEDNPVLMILKFKH